MNMLKEFREFAVRGNVVDMAVGIIIGAAFGKIVSSLVSDVVMPPIGLLIGGVDFTGLKFVLKSAAAEAPAVSLNYGIFLQTVLDFVIVAFAVFMLVKAVNTLKRKQEAAPAPTKLTKQEEILLEIRDVLKKGSGVPDRAR